MTQLQEFTISNDFLEAKILNRGGTLIYLAMKKDKRNIVVRNKDINDYIVNRGFLGACIGPLAGRTEEGKFTLNDKDYQLDKNVGNDHLHGGFMGLSKLFLTVVELNSNKITLIGTHDYTQQGYPSKIDYQIKYELMEDSLLLTMEASPDKECPINLTNHSYFNLSQEETINNHILKLDSKEIVTVKENGCNSNIHLNVKDTVFDFNQSEKLGDILKLNHEQFKITKHIDHTYILDKDSTITLFEPKTKKQLSIKSNAPTAQIYLANYFDETLTDEFDRKIKAHCGVAIEPQNIPNEINLSSKGIYSHENPFNLQIEYELKEI